MPSISPIKILGNLKFMSHGLKLPTQSDWQQPQGDPGEPHYGDSMPPEDKVAVPSLIPFWFQPQNMNKYHQASCDEVGQQFKDLHDTMIDAVKFSHDLWRLQAKFDGLKIMAVSAIGQPGCLAGPELESNIKNFPGAAAFTGNMAKWRDAIAAGVSKCFKEWQDQVMVPGLPWYPAFAAFPGPMAPPMPNIPMPLIACPSSKMTQIVTPGPLKDAMVDALDGGLKDQDPDEQCVALFDAVGTVLALSFMIWLASQQVMLVLGQGPIPTFAPPYVPVGPVINGSNIAIPGHLMT